MRYSNTPPVDDGTFDEIPWWVGWIGIVCGLTFVGFPVYSIWAYRRGRRNGVGRELVEAPYDNFGWRVMGWTAAAILLPLIDWYVLVHVPTLCYRHGMRVGAKERTAPVGFTSPAALASAMVSITVLLAGSIVLAALPGTTSTDTELQLPTVIPIDLSIPTVPSSPLLTGAEAAGKAEASLRQAVIETGRRDLSYACDPEDHNILTHQWVVACLVVGPQNAVNLRFTVNDRTGAVSEIK